MNRRTQHALVAEVGTALVVALGIALAMLAHATGSGSHEWAVGFGVGALVALLITLVVSIVVGCDMAVRAANAAWDRRQMRKRMTHRASGRTRPSRPRPTVAAADTGPWRPPPVDPAAAARDRGLIQRGQAGDTLLDVYAAPYATVSPAAWADRP